MRELFRQLESDALHETRGDSEVPALVGDPFEPGVRKAGLPRVFLVDHPRPPTPQAAAATSNFTRVGTTFSLIGFDPRPEYCR